MKVAAIDCRPVIGEEHAVVAGDGRCDQLAGNGGHVRFPAGHWRQ
jgi:hypothetical protein